MVISHFLSEDDISLDLVTKGKRSALSKIAARIAQRSGLDEQRILVGLLRREQLGATSVAHGVAIPHARLDIVASPVASLTRLARPIDFGNPDDDPVDLLFTLLWPQSEPGSFLPALAKACRLFRSSRIRYGLRQAQSADEVLAILRTEPQPTVSTSPLRTPISAVNLRWCNA